MLRAKNRQLMWREKSVLAILVCMVTHKFISTSHKTRGVEPSLAAIRLRPWAMAEPPSVGFTESWGGAWGIDLTALVLACGCLLFYCVLVSSSLFA